MAGRVWPEGQVFDTCGLDKIFYCDMRLREIIPPMSIKQSIQYNFKTSLLWVWSPYYSLKFTLMKMWNTCCHNIVHNIVKKDILEKCVNGHYYLLHFWINIAAKYKLKQAYQHRYGWFSSVPLCHCRLKVLKCL